MVFSCKCCEKLSVAAHFELERELDAHICATHMKWNPYECWVCGIKAPTAHSLRYHFRKHQPANEYKVLCVPDENKDKEFADFKTFGFVSAVKKVKDEPTNEKPTTKKRRNSSKKAPVIVIQDDEIQFTQGPHNSADISLFSSRPIVILNKIDDIHNSWKNQNSKTRINKNSTSRQIGDNLDISIFEDSSVFSPSIRPNNNETILIEKSSVNPKTQTNIETGGKRHSEPNVETVEGREHTKKQPRTELKRKSVTAHTEKIQELGRETAEIVVESYQKALVPTQKNAESNANHRRNQDLSDKRRKVEKIQDESSSALSPAQNHGKRKSDLVDYEGGIEYQQKKPKAKKTDSKLFETSTIQLFENDNIPAADTPTKDKGHDIPTNDTKDKGHKFQLECKQCFKKISGQKPNYMRWKIKRHIYNVHVGKSPIRCPYCSNRNCFDNRMMKNHLEKIHKGKSTKGIMMDESKYLKAFEMWKQRCFRDSQADLTDIFCSDNKQKAPSKYESSKPIQVVDNTPAPVTQKRPDWSGIPETIAKTREWVTIDVSSDEEVVILEATDKTKKKDTEKEEPTKDSNNVLAASVAGLGYVCKLCKETVKHTKYHVFKQHLKKPVFQCSVKNCQFVGYYDTRNIERHVNVKHGHLPLAVNVLNDFKDRLQIEVKDWMDKCFDENKLCRLDRRALGIKGLIRDKKMASNHTSPKKNDGTEEKKKSSQFCRVCQQCVADPEDHIYQNHITRRFQCPHCYTKRCSNLKVLKRHIFSQHKLQPHKSVIDNRDLCQLEYVYWQKNCFSAVAPAGPKSPSKADLLTKKSVAVTKLNILRRHFDKQKQRDMANLISVRHQSTKPTEEKLPDPRESTAPGNLKPLGTQLSDLVVSTLSACSNLTNVADDSLEILVDEQDNNPTSKQTKETNRRSFEHGATALLTDDGKNKKVQDLFENKKCELCSIKVSLTLWREHIFTHHIKKPTIKCPYDKCDRSDFFSVSTIKIHMELVHVKLHEEDHQTPIDERNLYENIFQEWEKLCTMEGISTNNDDSTDGINEIVVGGHSRIWIRHADPKKKKIELLERNDDTNENSDSDSNIDVEAIETEKEKDKVSNSETIKGMISNQLKSKYSRMNREGKVSSTSEQNLDRLVTTTKPCSVLLKRVDQHPFIKEPKSDEKIKNIQVTKASSRPKSPPNQTNKRNLKSNSETEIVCVDLLDLDKPLVEVLTKAKTNQNQDVAHDSNQHSEQNQDVACDFNVIVSSSKSSKDPRGRSRKQNSELSESESEGASTSTMQIIKDKDNEKDVGLSSLPEQVTFVCSNSTELVMPRPNRKSESLLPVQLVSTNKGYWSCKLCREAVRNKTQHIYGRHMLQPIFQCPYEECQFFSCIQAGDVEYHIYDKHSDQKIRRVPKNNHKKYEKELQQWMEDCFRGVPLTLEDLSKENEKETEEAASSVKVAEQNKPNTVWHCDVCEEWVKEKTIHVYGRHLMKPLLQCPYKDCYFSTTTIQLKSLERHKKDYHPKSDYKPPIDNRKLYAEDYVRWLRRCFRTNRTEQLQGAAAATVSPKKGHQYSKSNAVTVLNSAVNSNLRIRIIQLNQNTDRVASSNSSTSNSENPPVATPAVKENVPEVKEKAASTEDPPAVEETPTEEQPPTIEEPPTVATCNFCGKEISTSDDRRQRHVFSHMRKPTVRCPYPDCKFAHFYDLEVVKMHIEIDHGPIQKQDNRQVPIDERHLYHKEWTKANRRCFSNEEIEENTEESISLFEHAKTFLRTN